LVRRGSISATVSDYPRPLPLLELEGDLRLMNA
jgi:hypothetical protein